MSNTKLQFKHDFDPESGHEIELTIKCRLGAAPGLLRQLIDTSIEPLAAKYDPHYQPQQLPMQPPDNSPDELVQLRPPD
jgi:hypothetical protein